MQSAGQQDAQRDCASSVVGVVGTGTMGQGIAQIMAMAGHAVLLHDARPQAAASARAQIGKHLERMAEKGKLSGAQSQQAQARIEIADSLEALAACDVVIEAIVEDIKAKQGLFVQLEAIVRADCILATNTSSLSVTEIAAACARPQRVGGLHFFNPVPLMKVVEVIGGARTDASVLDTLCALIGDTGHQAVRAGDNPGFIVNLGGRGFSTEAARILSEGIASIQDIDSVLKDQAGFRLGPFELFDLTGLDVSLAATESIYGGFYQEARLRPAFLMRQRRNAGLFGRKTGQGFYRYEEGVIQKAAAPAVPEEAACRVWLAPADARRRDSVLALLHRLNIEVDAAAVPGDDSLCLVLPVGEDCTTSTLALSLDPTRTLALETLFGVGAHRVLMANPATTPEWRNRACAMLARGEGKVTLLNDSPAFVASRVVAHIVNIACDMAQQRVAATKDIDLAITLGLGYPHGPLTWGDRIGPAHILAVLEGLYACYRDERYRPSPWLTRRARLGLSLLSPD